MQLSPDASMEAPTLSPIQPLQQEITDAGGYCMRTHVTQARQHLATSGEAQSGLCGLSVDLDCAHLEQDTLQNHWAFVHFPVSSS